MEKDAIYDGEREVKTFVDLNHASNVLINQAEEEPKGWYYTVMSSLLLRAFTFEAYLNDLGQNHLKLWDEIESIKVLDKYSILCKELKLTVDFSKRPLQTLTDLFKFRNAIAHGRSRMLEETKIVSSKCEPHHHTPESFWEKYCTLKNAKRAKEDIEAIIIALHTKAGLGDYPFVHGVTISSVSINTPNKSLQATPENGSAER